MTRSIADFFDSGNFMPHGHCFLWQPDILWLHVLSDAAIAIAYFSIPFVLLHFVRTRKDMPFPKVFLLFGAFILLCGATHLMSIWVLWRPDYALEGVLKALTAIASIATFLITIKLIPQALLLASPKQLGKVNEELQAANRMLETLYRQSRESDQMRLRAVVDNVVDGIITIDERGTIESFNPACERIFGYGADEAIGKNIRMLMPEPYHGEHDGYLKNYRESGVAKIIGIGREVSGRRKDGSVFPMDLSVSAFRLEDGRHFSGIIRDITQRKQAEEAKAQLAAIVESSVDAIISKNLEGVILSWNKGAEHLFGYSAAEAIGQHIGLIIRPDQMEEDRYILAEIKAGKNVEHYETRRMKKGGELVDVSLTVSPVRNADGVITGASKILRDISERKETEKVHDQLRHAQKMESLGQLTGGIAHDFNNLLAVVLGNLDFLVERTKEDDPLRKFIKPSIEAAEHGAELTKQLLAFGRKQALQPKIVFLGELLPYFTVLVRHTLGERIEVILALGSNLWNVSVDPSQLQNALLNLAVNARDAMPDGGKLIIETHDVNLDKEYAANNADVVPGDYVVIAVSDTGEGMTQEIMEKAFEPFFTTKDVGKGSGLGLSMVYGFVKQSKGHIKLYSEPGHGTSIKIYLPRAEGDVSVVKQAKPEALPVEEKSALILVVEDNKEVLKLTSSMVQSLGYEVLQAETGGEAMRILEARSDIDLLLTDVMLPGDINGPALAKRALAIHPKLKVLFNSGYAEHAILESGILEVGVNLIGKPFRKQQLANKIEDVLRA